MWKRVAIVLALIALPNSHEQPLAAANVQVSATQFAAYIRDWSEPEGFFDSIHVMDPEFERPEQGQLPPGKKL